MSSLTEYRKQTNEKLLAYKQAKSSFDLETTQLEKTNEKIESAVEANQIIQTIAQTVQQKVHQRISSIVTRCLNAVFDDPYEFKIRFERKRGKTEATMVFVRDGNELDDPINSIGGGVIDIASLGLRLACILFTKPKLDRVLILDEPYKNVRGDEYKRRTKDMLLRLADDLGLQIIINTDIKEYQIGKVIELE
jgi:DNA repair exonuclease SbcCD ATPase subunit